ncbi:hypothetical protein [Nonomuraea indica]|uniref:hypothetical protein n=1 Tax=Nonomuraea indica TaxID=1581193 RepID=UPI000C7D02E5|nr:hypothetical protein [Nonomuraea indica]
MRTLLIAALVVCAMIPVLPPVREQMSGHAREARADLSGVHVAGDAGIHVSGETSLREPRAADDEPEPPPAHVVVDTFYVTVGIEVKDRLLPYEDDVAIEPTRLAPGVELDGQGNLRGKPRIPGSFTEPVRLCDSAKCVEQPVTLLVYDYVSWRPRQLTFPGRVGVRLDGHIGVEGGPAGVPPTFTVTNARTLPRGVSIGPDGQVGGIPAATGVSRVPVRICVAGNCSGVVVTLFIA